MKFLVVQIVRFVNDHQPGWVACEFIDAEGHSYTIVDKVPGLSSEDLDAGSAYPRPGRVGCEVVARWRDPDGRELLRISTAEPWGIESTQGVSEFVVLANQVESA